MPDLLNEDALSASSVVANSAMNRERQLAGVNSYQRELGFHPLDWLRQRLPVRPDAVAWLDLCCGSGRALIDAGEELRRDRLAGAVSLVGVDLVDAFAPRPAQSPVRFVTASVTTWRPPRQFDLITCVHGLHYVGDRLGVIARAAAALADDGLFVADFDASSIRRPDGMPVGRALTTALRAAGVTYDARRRRITVIGRREVALPFTYLGADDRAGPNYTNQPAVHAYYDTVSRR